MDNLGDIAQKVRSKNAGPFWLTIDIFCANQVGYDRLVNGLQTEQIAAVFRISPNKVARYDIGQLLVIKFSLPRPTVQGAVNDRDMHGASWAALLAETVTIS